MAARRLAALLACCVLSAAAWPQVPGLAGGASDPAVEAVPEGLESPRATLQTFLEAARSGDGAAARATLDLSEIDTVLRNEQGDRLTAALLDVINRTRFVDLTRVPDRTDGEPYVFHQYDGGRYEIVVARQSDGAWRFTSDTVAQINDVFEYVRSRGWETKADPRTGLRPREVDLLRASPALWLEERVPDEWKTPLLGVPVYNYLGLLVLGLVAFVAGLLVRVLTRFVVRSSLHIDEEVADKGDIKSLGRAISLIVNVELFEAGLAYLDLPYYVVSPTTFVLKLLSAVGWFWLLGKVWDVGVALVARRAGERRRTTHKIVVPVVSKFGRFLIGVAVVIVFIAQIGYDVRAVLAGLGIGGLVLALAAKDSVENLFGSITILMEMPFGVGDWVRIGDVDGEVEEINLRSTRIRTFEDSLITMPNSRMITSHVENLGARRRRRLKTALPLHYGLTSAEVEAFCESVRRMLREHPHVWDQKQYVCLNDIGEGVLSVLLYCYIEAPNYQQELEQRDDVLRRVIQIAMAQGVEFSIPTRTMFRMEDAPPPKEQQGTSDAPKTS